MAITEIEADDAAERAEAGALVLDVREDDEWAAGHVEGSVHIPMGELGERLSELPTDRSSRCAGRARDQARSPGHSAAAATTS